MAAGGQDSGIDLNCIQVCVRIRPLNPRERDGGHRMCVSYDEPSKQVVLTAVDRHTLKQLRGCTAKGYAFDKVYSSDETSDAIYDEAVASLVENCFKGYNATVLAYGQTGSGKTHTMSGGVGIRGIAEEGITCRVANHVFAILDVIRTKQKPGDKIQIAAYALELYNEELRDLHPQAKDSPQGGLKLQERPTKDGRVVPEVAGIKEANVNSAEELTKFFMHCYDNRSVSATKLNDRSSRSHAIYTITIRVTSTEVTQGANGAAKVQTMEFESKLHLVDLAGSERVKRSGVTGKELKEASHINSGLLALGNVIVALAPDESGKRKGHIPYRDSKLTRLLQDSLGGNSLTVLVSCISPSEADFEETNNTLKYANRACSIKNTPLPNKYLALEEDLLPMLPTGPVGNGFNQLHLAALLEEHGKMKEAREKRDRERKEKEAKRLEALVSMKDKEKDIKGYQRLRAAQYEQLRRQLASRNGGKLGNEVIQDEALRSFGGDRKSPATSEASTPAHRPSTSRSSRGGRDSPDIVTPRRTPRGLQTGEEMPSRSKKSSSAAVIGEDELTAAERELIQAYSPSVAGTDLGELDELSVVDDYDEELDVPKVLARFRVNQFDTLAVFKACTKEDFRDVITLLPENTPLPASDKMTYLLARLETTGMEDLTPALRRVARGELSMEEAVGPAVGCLMATFGTNMISSCIFDFDDPEELEMFNVEERIELWGLQIPHNSMRPSLAPDQAMMDAASAAAAAAAESGEASVPATPSVCATPMTAREREVVAWSSVDRLNMSIGLLYALCNYALDNDVRCGFCVPRPQLLRRWLQHGVRMRQIPTPVKLIYPPSAHDYDYYKASTVAYFMVDDVKAGLAEVLGLLH